VNIRKRRGFHSGTSPSILQGKEKKKYRKKSSSKKRKRKNIEKSKDRSWFYIVWYSTAIGFL